MTNIDIIIQVKNIEHIEIETGNSIIKPKTIIDFEICSYSKETNLQNDVFNKEKNKLLLFNKMSEFARNSISIDDYILAKGDLRIVSEEENLFLPNSIEILDKKKGKIISN